MIEIEKFLKKSKSGMPVLPDKLNQIKKAEIPGKNLQIADYLQFLKLSAI